MSEQQCLGQGDEVVVEDRVASFTVNSMRPVLVPEIRSRQAKFWLEVTRVWAASSRLRSQNATD